MVVVVHYFRECGRLRRIYFFLIVFIDIIIVKSSFSENVFSSVPVKIGWLRYAGFIFVYRLIIREVPYDFPATVVASVRAVLVAAYSLVAVEGASFFRSVLSD